MPTIERRYEFAVAVIDELRHFCVRLALALAAHDPDTKKTLNSLRRDHINSAFRVGGDDATLKAILEEFDKTLTRVGAIDKSIIPDVQASYRSHRNLGTRADAHQPQRKSVVLNVVKKG